MVYLNRVARSYSVVARIANTTCLTAKSINTFSGTFVRDRNKDTSSRPFSSTTVIHHPDTATNTTTTQSIKGRSRIMSDIFFGTTTTLNRFSFLRTDSKFIDQCFQHELSQLVFFKRDQAGQSVNPYVIKTGKTGDGAGTDARASGGGNQERQEIKQGDQDVTKEKINLLVLKMSLQPEWCKSMFKKWALLNKEQSKEIRDQLGFSVVFLGLDEDGFDDKFITCGNSLTKDFKYLAESGTHSTAGSNTANEILEYGNYKGVPFFAVEVFDNNKLDQFLLGLGNDNTRVTVAPSIFDILKLDSNEASIFSYSKMYLDWLMKNQFCPGCGSKVIPIDSGTKLHCTSSADLNCPVKRTKVNNVQFPRVDPVTIIAVLSKDGSKILLGHNKRHRKEYGSKMFTCVAGFMEPGETIEESTTREIWEETGVKASEIKIMKSQPWPFPACLMIGCIGVVEFNGINEKINIDLDKELDECKWFDVKDIKKLVLGKSLEGVESLKGITIPFGGSIAFELIKAAVTTSEKNSHL